MRIARVFPRKTSFSPMDEDAYFGPPGLFTPKYDLALVSVVFTEDIKEGQKLKQYWEGHATDVKIGGPAFGDPGEEFTPGLFCASGVVITHRGCVRNCPWCYVPEREGRIRHLEVKEGNILQDNNILACNREHKEKVWAMLRKQKAVSLRGGLDARLLKDEDIEAIRGLHLFDLWTAYDSEDNTSSLSAIKRLRGAGIPQNKIRCYVLVGFNGSTMPEDEERLKAVYEAGALPFAQLYDRYSGDDLKEWKRFSRKWSRPAIYKSVMKNSC